MLIDQKVREFGCVGFTFQDVVVYGGFLLVSACDVSCVFQMMLKSTVRSSL